MLLVDGFWFEVWDLFLFGGLFLGTDALTARAQKYGRKDWWLNTSADACGSEAINISVRTCAHLIWFKSPFSPRARDGSQAAPMANAITAFLVEIILIFYCGQARKGGKI